MINKFKCHNIVENVFQAARCLVLKKKGSVLMCVIINLDLIVPVVIKSEMSFLDRIGAQDYMGLTISPNMIMNYAQQLKKLDLGRIVINFTKEDVIKYLDMHSNIYQKIGESQVYKISNKDITNVLHDMIIRLNYPDVVLETVNLISN